MFVSTLFAAVLPLVAFVFAAPLAVVAGGEVADLGRDVAVAPRLDIAIPPIANVYVGPAGLDLDVDLAPVADVNVAVPRDVVSATVATAIATLKADVDAAIAAVPLAGITAEVAANVLLDVKGAILAFIHAVVGISIRVRDATDVVDAAPTVLADTISDIVNFINSLPAEVLADGAVAPLLATIDGLLGTVLSIVAPIVDTVVSLLNDLGVFSLLSSLGLSSILSIVVGLGL